MPRKNKSLIFSEEDFVVEQGYFKFKGIILATMTSGRRVTYGSLSSGNLKICEDAGLQFNLFGISYECLKGIGEKFPVVQQVFNHILYFECFLIKIKDENYLQHKIDFVL